MPDTLTDPMAGFDPQEMLPRDGEPPNPQPGYEFDPRKEIDPMAGRFFADVEANPMLSRQDKLRIQSRHLEGLTDVRMQREKIESEKLRNIMDRQRIAESNMALTEMRRRQEDIARSAERQKGVADTVKGIIASDLPPEEKRKQIAMWEIDNAASIHSDPAIRSTVETAKSLIPAPLEPLYSTKEMRDKLEKGVPPEVVMGGDPVEIGYYERIFAAQEKERSDNIADRKVAAKEYRSTIMQLAKEIPLFMTEEQASAAGVATQPVEKGGDPNALKYLTPESHQKGRILIGLLRGSAGLAEFERLSDAEKREAIMVAQKEAVMQALKKADAVADVDQDDATVDSLLFGR